MTSTCNALFTAMLDTKLRVAGNLLKKARVENKNLP